MAETYTDKYLVVAAIDFGTAYSGYAFSTRNDFEKDPLKIVSNNCNSGQQISSKTPTCALFDNKKKFVAFGYEAEDQYANLFWDKEHHDYYFFRRFKMSLFDKMKLQRQFKIEDELGKKMPALDVFSACIKFLKDHLIKSCKNALSDISEKDFRFVLTVPAIWNDASKQFMREAAEKAGINSDRLIIALEPEAASLCCQHIPFTAITNDGKGFRPFAPKSKYIVLDAGGGTVDITVHEVQTGGYLRELFKANGGNWGGTFVDKAYRDLWADIVGNNVLDDFQANNISDYMDMFREFEIKKRTITTDMQSKVTIRAPSALVKAFEDTSKKTIGKKVDEMPRLKGKLAWITDKLRISPEIIESLFATVCDRMVAHLETLFKTSPVNEVDTILMVGGFSESPLLQEKIKSSFPKKKIIIPDEAGLAVLKGAVIYGHNPKAIQERRARYTYGVRTSLPFKEGKDPEEKKLRVKGIDYCEGKFHSHVTIGQPLKCGEAQMTQSYRPTDKDQRAITFKFFATTEKEPNFVTDPRCTEIGNLRIELGGSGLDRSVLVRMIFSGTELCAEAENKQTNEKIRAILNFLG